jgi:hypothetical protein
MEGGECWRRWSLEKSGKKNGMFWEKKMKIWG